MKDVSSFTLRPQTYIDRELPFGGRSAHLVYHVYQGGCRTRLFAIRVWTDKMCDSQYIRVVIFRVIKMILILFDNGM